MSQTSLESVYNLGMRSLVPAMLILVLVSVSFVQSAQAQSQLPSLMAGMGGACPQSGGAGASGDPTAVGCDAQAKVFCSLLQASDCSNYSGSTSRSGEKFKPEFGANQTKQAFVTRADNLERKVAQDANRAKSCCGNGDSCGASQYGLDRSTSVALAAQRNKKNGSQGLHNDSGTDAQALNDGSVHNANIGGMCRAFRAVCQQKYQMMAEKLKSNEPCQASDQECKQESQSRQQKYADAAQECGSLDSSSYERSAQEMAGAQKKATDSQGKSAADSGTSPGGASGGDQSGMSGKDAMQALGKMLPMAMQAMQMMNQGNQNDQQGMNPQDFMNQGDCYSNPSMPGCTPQAAQAAPPEMGDAGMASSLPSRGKFNMADSADAARLPTDIADRNGMAGTPPTVKGIAGGGGGMPGGGGGGAASLGGGGNGGGPGYKPTNVQLGEASGASGFSKIASDMNMQNGGGGGGYNYGGGADSNFQNMNLADFLPGGRNDPSRGRGPAGLGGNGQIQGKSVNIWNRISEKMRNRCAQGLLRDCGS